VTKSGYDVLRCAACALVYVWPQPTAAELEAFYSAARYHATADAAARRRYFAARLRQIERLVPRRGRILDVGCAQGLFLEVARAEGWDTAGIDLDRKGVEAARARGLDVHQGELQPGGFPPQSFDVVTLFDLLEHVRDPRGLVAACREVLRPGGFLVVTTPDVSGLVPRVTYGLFALTLGAWGHPTPPGHLVQFSRRTLGRLLADEGFEPVLVRREHIPVAYSVGKLEDSILDVLAGRHRRRPAPTLPQVPEGEEGRPTGALAGRAALKRMARWAVRALAWTLVGATGLAARATGQGDSMRVAARCPAQGLQVE
jgi:SAM-dependent methyltransferase